jgi:hypothetical protein
MAAVKKSLDEAQQIEVAAEPQTAMANKKAKKPPTPEEIRRQPAFKLPIEGGQKDRLER